MSENPETFKIGDRVVRAPGQGEYVPATGVIASVDENFVRLDGSAKEYYPSRFVLETSSGSENPKAAFGNLKTPILSVIPSPPLLQVGEVMRRGAEKYGAYNWRESRVNTSTYIDAALRHLMSYQDGETLDPDDNQSHLAHAAASLFVVMDALAVGNATDDRPKAGIAAEFIAAMAKTRG